MRWGFGNERGAMTTAIPSASKRVAPGAWVVGVPVERGLLVAEFHGCRGFVV